MTAAEVSRLLAEAGVQVAPADVAVAAREDRWMVQLPEDKLAWFPASEAGAGRLATEARVLDLLADAAPAQANRKSAAGSL